MAKKKNTVTATRQNVSKRGKIWVMAIDPFSALDLKPAIEFAHQMAVQDQGSLLGAYVLAPASLNWSGEFSGPWINRYKPLAEEKLQELFAEFGERYEVLPCKEPGLKASVQKLIRFSQKLQAAGIIVSTHARTGLERWTLGSFAESAVLLAGKRPVIVLNPERSIPKAVTKVMIPTDLSAAGRRFVLSWIPHLKRWKADLHLFYKRPDPLDPIIQQGVYSLGGGWISAQSFLADENDRNIRELKSWQQHLTDKGIRCTSQVDSGPGELAESILESAKRQGVQMIALPTHSGPWAATLLGSVARDLIRKSPIPVLVQQARS